MPRDTSDHALLEFSQICVTKAEPLKQVFIDSNIAPDFLETLSVAIRNLQTAIGDQTASQSDRFAAAATIAKTRSEAQLLQRFAV